MKIPFPASFSVYIVFLATIHVVEVHQTKNINNDLKKQLQDTSVFTTTQPHPQRNNIKLCVWVGNSTCYYNKPTTLLAVHAKQFLARTYRAQATCDSCTPPSLSNHAQQQKQNSVKALSLHVLLLWLSTSYLCFLQGNTNSPQTARVVSRIGVEHAGSP